MKPELSFHLEIPPWSSRRGQRAIPFPIVSAALKWME